MGVNTQDLLYWLIKKMKIRSNKWKTILLMIHQLHGQKTPS